MIPIPQLESDWNETLDNYWAWGSASTIRDDSYRHFWLGSSEDLMHKSYRLIINEWK